MLTSPKIPHDIGLEPSYTAKSLAFRFVLCEGRSIMLRGLV